MEYAPYGYVWLPDVPRSFSPYLTHGHWVYTGFGWTWYSYYRWGWAPFHYGRWHYDVVYGWMWLPDTIWGPAWVVWRRGGGYCGWAPLGFGITIQIALGPGHIVPHEHWIFVPESDLPKRNIDRHRVDRARNSEFVERASVTQQVRRDRDREYLPGPERGEIEQYTGRRINERALTDRATPGMSKLKKRELGIYRPEVMPERTGEPKARPPYVYAPEDVVAPSRERKVRTRPQPVPQREVTRQPDDRPEREREISRERERQQTRPADRQQPEIRREQERRTEPQRRPSRTAPPKKKPADDQVDTRMDRSRRN